MSQPVPHPEQKVKALDQALLRFSTEITDAKMLSDKLYEKAIKISNFTLNCDQEKAEARIEEPEGHLSNLNDLIYALRFLNRRNAEILEHLNEIL